MMEAIKEDTARFIMHIAIRREEDEGPARGPRADHKPAKPLKGPKAPASPAEEKGPESSEDPEWDEDDIPPYGPGSEEDDEDTEESEGPGRGLTAEDMRKNHAAVQKLVRREAVAKVTGTNKDETMKRGPVKKDKKIMPNDPCPCGSGLKYKKCCGK